MCKQLYPFSDPPTVPGTNKDTNLVAPVTTRAGTKRMRTEIIETQPTVEDNASAENPTGMLPRQQDEDNPEIRLPIDP
jgi:hypothetical protein